MAFHGTRLLFIGFVFLVSVYHAARAGKDDRILEDDSAILAPFQNGTCSASWYGVPDGAGNEAGTCGYRQAVAAAPFSSMVAAGPNRYWAGNSCGACYKVKCSSHEVCSQEWVMVTVTDQCSRAVPCLEDPKAHHFDLSGHAFGAMAKPGRADELRAANIVSVEYEWVDCHYTPPANIVYPAFQILPGSTNDNFAITVLYIDGAGIRSMISVLLKNSGSDDWQEMSYSRGGHYTSWNFTDYSTRLLPVRPPVSIKVSINFLRIDKDMVTVTAEDVIPLGWQLGVTYYNVIGQQASSSSILVIPGQMIYPFGCVLCPVLVSFSAL